MPESVRRLGADLVDLLLRHAPRFQGPQRTRHGNAIGLHPSLGFPQASLGNRTVLGGRGQSGQRLFIDAQLREAVDQFALLLSEIAAPHDREQLVLRYVIAEIERPGHCRRLPQLDHFAREPRMDPGQSVRVED